MEAFDDSHFMHQAVRVGHTDHTGSIVSLTACIFDLKKKFLCNWTLIKIVQQWTTNRGFEERHGSVVKSRAQSLVIGALCIE